MLDDIVLRHNCGIAVAHSLHDVYSFGAGLQHRGREAAGIAAIGNDRIDVVKWEGNVKRIDVTDLVKILPGHQYHTYMMHIRYATKGRKDQILVDAHPHTIGGKKYEMGDHVFIFDCDAAIVHNGQVDEESFQDMDKSRLQTGCDTESLLHYYMQNGEIALMKNIPLAYTLAIADKRKKDIVVLRDRTGIKPGVLGWKDGKFVVASENIAFDKNGAEFREDLKPGSIYYMHPEGNYDSESVVDPKLKYCYFEYNYVAHMLSIIQGVPVRVVREMLGGALTEELAEDPVIKDLDVITYMPRCPEPAARVFAKGLNKPFEYVFYKPRNERAFQGSTLEDRAESIKGNLHLIPGMEEYLRGKKVGVVDDSIIRGNNSKRGRDLLYEDAGVESAVLISYTPQVGIMGNDGEPRGCTFGVDMPPTDKFIARDRTIDEISKKMGMPVRYLSLDGMLNVFRKLGMPKKDLCYFCVGGPSPVELK